jgi:quercetin dioxygenase-like cupin family protein
MSGAVPVVTQQEAGETIWFGGGLITFKVTSEQAGGALCLFEHGAIHPDNDETFCVLEGELRFHINGTEQVAGPGAVVWIPRGTPHAFLVTSAMARSLCITTPGTVMEAFFRQAGDVAVNRSLPPPEIDMPRLLAVGEATGAMEFLGPPPFPQEQHA